MGVKRDEGGHEMSDQDQQQSAHEPMTAARLEAIRARAEARPLLDFGGVEQPGNGPHARKRVQACFADRLALLAFAEAALPVLSSLAAELPDYDRSVCLYESARKLLYGDADDEDDS